MPGETQGQSHQISNASIGPDGKLYIHNGDGFNAATAQNLDSYRGKILRLNLDGSAPSDNPFYDDANGINARDYVFAYGVRNPFGGAWRAADGDHYSVENGPSIDRLARIEAGVDYGWDGTNSSMRINALYNWSPAHAPVNITFVQPETFGGSRFPLASQNRAFVSESGPTYFSGPQVRGKRIVSFEFDASGEVVGGPTTFVEYVGTGRATVVGLTAGPDGLYFTELYRDLDAKSPIDRGARVLRVRFDAGDVSFTADATSGAPPLSVQFSDTSTLVGGSAWHWDFGDGATSTLQNPTHLYPAVGIYDVSLTVTGAVGDVTLTREALITVARPGDFNFDNRINGDDFLIWQANFGTRSGATVATGDADGDGDVDGGDFLAWQAGFGTALGRGASVAAADFAAVRPLIADPPWIRKLPRIPHAADQERPSLISTQRTNIREVKPLQLAMRKRETELRDRALEEDWAQRVSQQSQS